MHRLQFRPSICAVICLLAVLSGCGATGSGVSGSPSWNLALSQAGSFAPGGTGQYSIAVSNSGSGASNGTLTVSDSLPGGNVFTPTSLSGTGWSCTLSSVTCTRSDSLAGGESYEPILLAVSVTSNASGALTDQATVSGGGGADASKSITTQVGVGGNGKIQHVVIIFQENRTPDNLFHDPILISRGADIASTGVNSSGTTITLTPVSLQTDYDLGHGHDSFISACDWNGKACKMDTQDQVPCAPPANCPSNPQFQYVKASDVQPYFTMAETYTFGDRMFQTNQGPSFPAHQYVMSGSSAVCVPGASCPSGTTNSYYIAGNPANDQRADGSAGAGCLTPPGTDVNFIDTSKGFPNNNLIDLTSSECAEHPTLTDLLDQAGLSWKYYAATDGSIWTAPDGIQHICEPGGPPNQLACKGTEWNNHVVLEGSGSQIVTDIQNSKLAAVTWVIPDGHASDHANGNKGLGPSWVASIVNAIGQSPYWANTAIIVTWDDWGGWYDHVPPPIRNREAPLNSYEYGFRVPLIVISPYAKPQYISHQQNDFGSILKFVETTFSLPTTIGESVGAQYADSYADMGDLSDCFDYSQTPLNFTPVQAPKDAQFFLHNKQEPSPPDTD